MTFDCIVTTKVETAAEITPALARLREASVAFRTVIPIVETRRGIAARDEIAAAARDAGLNSLCCGHFDYALDSGWWPIRDPSSPSFWEGVEPRSGRSSQPSSIMSTRPTSRPATEPDWAE